MQRTLIQQAAWVAAGTGVGAAAAVGLWATQPEIALCIGLAAAPVAAAPRRWWAAPLIGAGVAVAGLGATAIGISPVLGAGLAAGAAVTWMAHDDADTVDLVHGALATAAGAGLGLLAGVALLPETLSLGAGIAVMALVSLVSAQGMLPAQLRHESGRLPSQRAVRKLLRPAYRQPVWTAFQLYETARHQAPDGPTQRGLGEVARWVFHLQRTLQSLDDELGGIDVVQIEDRIRTLEASDDDDAFTNDRRLATARHLRTLLSHRDAIRTERGRTDSLVEYALAFLEEARAGLTLARELPGESSPARLGDVLGKLRAHAADGDLRRRTAREVDQLEA